MRKLILVCVLGLSIGCAAEAESNSNQQRKNLTYDELVAKAESTKLFKTYKNYSVEEYVDNKTEANINQLKRNIDYYVQKELVTNALYEDTGKFEHITNFMKDTYDYIEKANNPSADVELSMNTYTIKRVDSDYNPIKEKCEYTFVTVEENFSPIKNIKKTFRYLEDFTHDFKCSGYLYHFENTSITNSNKAKGIDYNSNK